MRIAVITILLATVAGGPAVAQVSTPVLTRPPAWQKSVSMSKALVLEDAKARGRAAYLAGKSPEVLIVEVRAAHPSSGDEFVTAALKEARLAGKEEVDQLKGMGEEQSQKLQMAMDRLSAVESALSNLLRKASETQSSVTQNLK